MTYVLALAAISPDQSRFFGGKAAGCAALQRLGLCVPSGFAISTAAFDRFVESAKLGPERAELEQAFRGAAPAAEREARCAALQQRVRTAALPADLVAQVGEQLRHLTGPLAVRSSASVEDSALSAFAGLFHSELDVAGEEIEAAIRTCWAEVFSVAVFHHALKNNIDPALLRVGLVIQEMVAAERAGVVFTRDPAGAHPEDAIVVSTEGVGEALMQGEVEGESQRVSRGLKGVEDPFLRRLVGTACKVERAFRHPQDIEWAQAGGEIYYLQSRPITTLDADTTKPVIWTRELAEERYPEVISPLGWSALQGVFQVTLDTLAKRFGLVARRPDRVARTIRHYVYTDEAFFKVPGSLRPNPLAHLHLMPGYARHFLGMFWQVPLALVRGRFGPRFVLYSRLLRAAVFPHAREISNSWNATLAELLAEMDRCDEVDPAALDVDGLFAHHARIEELAKHYMEPDLAIWVVKMACSWLVEKIGVHIRGHADASFIEDLSTGLDDNRTLAMNLEMEALADAIRADPALRARLRAGELQAVLDEMEGEPKRQFDAFLERNGHLTTNWDLKEPTWGEAPINVLQMLRCHVHSDGRRSHSSLQEERRARYHAARAAALAAMAESGWMVAFFEELLSTLHEFMLIDEEHHFYCSRLYRPMRRLLAELGNRLVEREVIDDAEDAYFLELDEIRAALAEARPFTRRYLVEARRGSFMRAASTRPPNRFRDQTPIKEENKLLSSGDFLQGVAASPGVASGPVRVVTRPSDVSDFQPGEVLVTASPNPAWTPIYAVASAMITSTGSILSHGLVSAREYELPAVIGIEDAPRRLQNGQKVTVDGDQGIISFERE